MRSLPLIDDTFFTTAPFVLRAQLEVPHTPEQVWSAMTGDAMGSWIPMLDRGRWLSPRPLGPAARRSLRIARLFTIVEDYYHWEERRRQTFRVTAISLPVMRGWAEDIQLEPLATGGTRLSWTMALDNALLRLVRIPRFLQARVDALALSLVGGITGILPPPPAPQDRPDLAGS